MKKSSANLAELLQHGYRYALSITHNTTQAEDLLQDAWVAILQADGPQNKGYLFTAIRNHFINHSKRDKLVPMVALESYEAEQHQNDSFFEITNETLQQSLEILRPVEREALFLSAVEGYTAEEIANHTKQPRGTILSLIHRARKKVRQYFKRDIKDVMQ